MDALGSQGRKAAQIMDVFAAVPDCRSQVNELNSLISDSSETSSSSFQTELDDPETASRLLHLLVKCVGKHHTVLDIMKHMLDKLANGSSSLVTNLNLALRRYGDSADLTGRISLLTELASFPAGREVIAAGGFEMAACTVRDLLHALDEFCRSTEPCGKITVDRKMREDILKGLEWIRQLLFLPNGDGYKSIILSEICNEIRRGLESALRSFVRCDVLLMTSVANLLLDCEPYLDSCRIYGCPKVMDFVGALRKPASTIVRTSLLGKISHNVFRKQWQCASVWPQYEQETLNLSEAGYVVAYWRKVCELAQNGDRFVEEFIRKTGLSYWKLLFSSQEEKVSAKIVDFLRITVKDWSALESEAQEEIFHDLAALPWSSAIKLRCWTLLLPCSGKERFVHAEGKTPLDLLRLVPYKFYRSVLAEIVSGISDPESISQILMETSEYNAFLMKSVLPVVTVRPGFLLAVLKRLKGANALTGYASILFAFRAVKQSSTDQQRKFILNEYIRGNYDLPVHHDDLVRLETFGFLCEHGDPDSDFDYFAQFVGRNLDHQFSRFREPFIRSAGRFIGRVDVVLRRKKVSQHAADGKLGERCTGFLFGLMDHCIPSSSYARRSSALNLLKIVLSLPSAALARQPEIWTIISRTLMEQLFWESFPDNQSLIVEVLALKPVFSSDSSEYCGFSVEALRRISDDRARRCTDARISVHLDKLVNRGSSTAELGFRILDQLDEDVEWASTKGLEWAARNRPLYGHLYRLRSLFETGQTDDYKPDFLLDRTLLSCWKVLELVNSVFDDHGQAFSMDHGVVTEDGTDEGTTAQMLFVCCWRCIRETALLFGELVCGNSTASVLKMEEKEKIFCWSISQMRATRHTGTFETLAELISKMSRNLLSKSLRGGDIVRSWLVAVVAEVTGTWNSPLKPENTRKSAGIPRLLCMLYSAVRKTEMGEDSFCSVCDVLLKTGGNRENEVGDRVRAVNILEALFRENALNELSEKFVARGFILACNGVGSDLWPIRNAAASLFTGLMQRVFGPGVKKNREELEWRECCLSCYEFFEKYPEFFDYAKECLNENQLESGVHFEPQNRVGSKLFCLFMVLSRLYRSAEDQDYIEDLADIIYPYLCYPEYRIRELVAVVCAYFLGTNAAAYVKTNLETFVTQENDFHLHGLLILLQSCCCHRSAFSTEKWKSLGDTVCRLLPQILLSDKYSNFTKALAAAVGREFSSENCKRIVDFAALCGNIIQTDAEKDLSEPGSRLFHEEMHKTFAQRTELAENLSVRRTRKHSGSPDEYRMKLSSLEFASDQLDVEEMESELEVLLSCMEHEEDPSQLATCTEEAGALLVCVFECGNRRSISEKVNCGRRYLELTLSKVIPSGNMDLRLRCAKAFPGPVWEAKIPAGRKADLLVCLYWITVLKILQDDDMKVRDEMARRIREFGLCSFVPTSDHANSLILDRLVHCCSHRDCLELLICMTAAVFVNDDDRVSPAESDGVIFENCDRHEYHENLRILELLRIRILETVPKIVPNGTGGNGKSVDELHGFLEKSKTELDYCLQFLESRAFLDDVNAYNRVVFRLFTTACALLMLRHVSARYGERVASLLEAVEKHVANGRLRHNWSLFRLKALVAK